MSMIKIANIVGARPQFIKAATLSRCITSQEDINEVLIHTGQHYNKNMSDVFFSELDIRQPDHHLGIGGGTHGENTGRMIEAIEKVLVEEKPDFVVVYGDTDSTLAAAIAAVKLHFPLAHVEAGLRSFNRHMPEEINRVLTDHASNLLFVPTITALSNLAAEGIMSNKIRLVGDVMYDAAQYYQAKSRKPAAVNIEDAQTFVLCTIHRAENTDNDARMEAIVRMINQLAEHMPVVLPLHPRTITVLNRLKSVKLSPIIQVLEPVGFLEMTWLLAQCNFVVTDSGGVQKEAYFHQKPCLTLREETEWVELIDAGFNRLISPFETNVLELFKQMQSVVIPRGDGIYGDGDAAEKIIDQIVETLSNE
jgi:UDP-GlcNAc3NAcA epimerase